MYPCLIHTLLKVVPTIHKYYVLVSSIGVSLVKYSHHSSLDLHLASFEHMLWRIITLSTEFQRAGSQKDEARRSPDGVSTKRFATRANHEKWMDCINKT